MYSVIRKVHCKHFPELSKTSGGHPKRLACITSAISLTLLDLKELIHLFECILYKGLSYLTLSYEFCLNWPNDPLSVTNIPASVLERKNVVSGNMLTNFETDWM